MDCSKKCKLVIILGSFIALFFIIAYFVYNNKNMNYNKYYKKKLKIDFLY